MDNIQISLDSIHNDFVNAVIQSGRYDDVNAVISAGLSLLEEKERKIIELKSAIDEGEKSGIVADFDANQHLLKLKSLRANG